MTETKESYFKNNDKNREICEVCGNTSIIRDQKTGEVVCPKCGNVLSSLAFNFGPEWRAFDPVQREKLSRTGAPLTPLMHDMGISTTIGWQSKDASGRRLTPEQKAKMYRLRKWHRRSKVSASSSRNLATALNSMTKIANKMRLPQNVIKTAAMFYRKAIKKNLIRGRTIHSVVTATLYMASRQCGGGRTIAEVAESANITRKEAARNYRFLLRKLQTDVPALSHYKLLSKYVNKLRLSGHSELLARKILNKARELRITNGRGPSGITAAALYISTKTCGEDRTQGEIASVAGVTEVTIRNRYKEMNKEIDLTIKI